MLYNIRLKNKPSFNIEADYFECGKQLFYVYRREFIKGAFVRRIVDLQIFACQVEDFETISEVKDV